MSKYYRIKASDGRYYVAHDWQDERIFGAVHNAARFESKSLAHEVAKRIGCTVLRVTVSAKPKGGTFEYVIKGAKGSSVEAFYLSSIYCGRSRWHARVFAERCIDESNAHERLADITDCAARIVRVRVRPA